MTVSGNSDLELIRSKVGLHSEALRSMADRLRGDLDPKSTVLLCRALRMVLKDIKRTLEYDAGYLFDDDLHEEFEDDISTGLSIIYNLLVEAPEPAARTARLLLAHALAESTVDAIREGLESEADGETRAEKPVTRD